MANLKLGHAQLFAPEQATRDQAAEAFRTAATLQPNLAVAQFYYGYALKRQGYHEWETNRAQGNADLAEAVAVLKKAEEIGDTTVRRAAKAEQAIYLPSAKTATGGKATPQGADGATP